MPKLLTKSKYVLGLQCPRLLWKEVNDKANMPEPDLSAQQKFKVGNLVGELAKKLFPEGNDASNPDFNKNIELTKKFLKLRKPVFEAAIMIGNLDSRADILSPVGKDEWDILEVKSATEVKDINIQDVSFQKHVYQKAGLKIRKCFLIHLNNEYVKNGEIEPQELFIQADITQEAKSASIGIEDRIENMLKIINSAKMPITDIGPYCSDPYECVLNNECWEKVPKESVFDLYRMGKKAHELYGSGIKQIKDIPDGFKLTDKQKIQKECATNGKCNIDKEKISKFLKELKYPLYYLDFETINPAIPKYDGMKPYQRIGFQYSLHIQKEKGGKTQHFSFLAEGTDDPRPKFLQSLKENLGKKGDIIVYNESFEKGVLKEHCEAFPEFEGEWLNKNILPRVKDLLTPFREFHYYDPKQCGSASIKAVLPVLSDLSYKQLEIGNGGDASVKYEIATYDPNITKEEEKKIRDALEKYCELDTLAEVKIVERLGEIVEK